MLFPSCAPVPASEFVFPPRYVVCLSNSVQRAELEAQNAHKFGAAHAFDPDFVRAERVLNKQITIERDADAAMDVNVDRYLIKWAGLGYTHATWEHCDVVQDGAQTFAHRLFLFDMRLLVGLQCD